MRAIGPTCETGPNGLAGQAGTRPNVGLSPGRPQNAHGIRIEPPPSVPSASGTIPAASAAELPPLEPPGVLRRVPRVAGDAGQRAVGDALPAELGRGRLAGEHGAGAAQRGDDRRVVVPWARPGRSRVEPRSVGQPLVTSRSLTATGTPSSGPAGSPRAQRASDARASVERRLGVDEAEGVEASPSSLLDPLERRLGRPRPARASRRRGRRRRARSAPAAASVVIGAASARSAGPGGRGRCSTATTSRRRGGRCRGPACSSTIRLWQAVTPEPQ